MSPITKQALVLFPLLLLGFTEAGRFQFQGPIVTLTLRDPSSRSSSPHVASPSPGATITRPTPEVRQVEDDTEFSEGAGVGAQEATKPKPFWRKIPFRNSSSAQTSLLHGNNIIDLNSLSPTVLYAIRSANPLPNYFPALQSTSLTASYNYHDIKDRPNFVEGDVRLQSQKLNFDVDIGASYNVKEDSAALTIGMGTMEDASNNDGRGGCFASARFLLFGHRDHKRSGSKPGSFAASAGESISAASNRRNYLQNIRAQFRQHLPFNAVGSLSITPSFDFDVNQPYCTIVGKTGSGRTAAVLELNVDRPTLSIIHALDERSTIQPEISLLDAKILYNWSVTLKDGSGSIRTRVDPTEAVQISWIDQTRNGKWVTDFRLPLASGPSSGSGRGALASDIRVRRQFVF